MRRFRSVIVWPVFLATLALTIWLLTRGVLGGRDPTWARIQETKVWRVGMDPSFPPFEDLDPATGRPVGFDVDLARAIADRWGVRVEIVGVGFDQLVDAVTAHRIDSAISALPIVPHRAKEVAFSMPYFEAGVVLATPLGSAIRQPAEGSNERSPEPSSRAQVEGRSRRRLAEVLAGLRVAVEWGSEGDAQARRLQRELNGNLTLVLRPSADAALAAAFAGEAEAVITDAVSLALFNRNGRKLTAVGEPLRSDPYVIVMPVAAPRLRQAVDEALAALAADGTLGDLAARWLGPTK